MTTSPYTLVSASKPPHGTICIARRTDKRPHLTIFHKAIGDPKSGGDFASLTYTAKGAKIVHLPDIVEWMAVPL